MSQLQIIDQFVAPREIATRLQRHTNNSRIKRRKATSFLFLGN